MSLVVGNAWKWCKSKHENVIVSWHKKERNTVDMSFQAGKDNLRTINNYCPPSSSSFIIHHSQVKSTTFLNFLLKPNQTTHSLMAARDILHKMKVYFHIDPSFHYTFLLSWINSNIRPYTLYLMKKKNICWDVTFIFLLPIFIILIQWAFLICLINEPL